MRRRTVLHVVGGTGLIAISGCLGDGGDGEGSDGDGDSSNDGDSDDADGNEDSSDDGDDNGNGGDGSSDLSNLEEPESYMMEQQFPEDSGGDGLSMVYEVHGDDMMFYEEGAKDEHPSYIIDGDMYSVTGDQCILMEDETDDEASDAPEYVPGETYSFEQIESETIDGVEMDVYRREGTEDARYYVDPETNYLRRIDHGEDAPVTDFHSFNEVDPIEPPDMDCQSLGGE